MDTPFLQPLNGVWTGPDAATWFAGNYGEVGGLDESGRWLLPEAPLSSEHLHAAWKHDDEVLFVGGNLLDSEDHYGTILRLGPRVVPSEVQSCG